MKPKISIYNDHQWTHYEFVRDSKLPRGTFDRSALEELGHALAPIVAIVGVLVVLVVMAVLQNG